MLLNSAKPEPVAHLDYQPLGQLHTGTESLYLSAVCPWHTTRSEVEAFIADAFQREHRANVNHFMPVLLTLQSSQGELQAVAGLRTATQQKLFLEQYMDLPIERMIASVLRKPVDRQHIVEIGNLAANRQGASRYLFVALTALLMQWDLPWLSFTGTRQVHNVFKRLGLNPVSVCPANKSRLSIDSSEWGSYYDKDPHVMIGDVQGGYNQLVALNAFSALNLQINQGESHVRSA